MPHELFNFILPAIFVLKSLVTQCLKEGQSLCTPRISVRSWFVKINDRFHISFFISLSFTDTFASKVAAIQDQYADASIGNVTGSNAVNVFLGIGVAWTIAAVYWKSKGQVFKVDPGSLAFSITVFTTMALVCVMVLLYRRRPSVAGGELGGPRTPKLLTFFMFLSLWFVYILLSSLEAYCHFPSFWDRGKHTDTDPLLVFTVYSVFSLFLSIFTKFINICIISYYWYRAIFDWLWIVGLWNFATTTLLWSIALATENKPPLNFLSFFLNTMFHWTFILSLLSA